MDKDTIMTELMYQQNGIGVLGVGLENQLREIVAGSNSIQISEQYIVYMETPSD